MIQFRITFQKFLKSQVILNKKHNHNYLQSRQKKAFYFLLALPMIVRIQHVINMVNH